MQVCLFLTGKPAQEPLLDMQRMREAATQIEGLRQFIIHAPFLEADARVDPRIAASAEGPSCVFQFYFDELDALETALRFNGAIHTALHTCARAPLDHTAFTQQIMAVRKLTSHAMSDTTTCTYLVAYEGPADDFNAWLTHYLQEHPALMLQLPALRELEIYTRLDATSALPFQRETAMQRNKVVFDNADALAHALASPVRDAMRRDFHALPSYHGATPHFAMRSACVNLATR